MTEYFRDPQNRIRAGFALHAGNLFVQYQRLSASIHPSERYEATLTLCILQSLLTQCAELIKQMSKIESFDWEQAVTDIPTRWGLRRGFIKEDTNPETLTYRKFLEHLRNACSHPTDLALESFPMSTGYSTIPGPTGLVEAFEFVDSPSVQNGRLRKQFRSNVRQVVQNTVTTLNNAWMEENQTSEEPFHVVRIGEEYQVYKNDNEYVRLFRAIIPLSDLTETVKFLANYLAQPSQHAWDGKTIKQLVA